MNGATMRLVSPAGRMPGQRGDPFTSPKRGAPGAPPVVSPTGKALVEGYRKDILNDFGGERPRYNPGNESRPQSSPLVDLKDPIQVHLLTETALSDSKTYEILSQEEVDDLKKQIQSLSMRVEQARTNLAIQSKYRDAAISMARLYSPPSTKGDGNSKRRSLLGNRMSDSAKEAEMEKQASERRCEELASELFSLEKRLMEPQRRLLQHTAGILQMTHRVSGKKPSQLPVGPMMNGIPSSPESLYTYTNTRNSMEVPSSGADFDFDKSPYLDGLGAPRKNAIEIPLKSPIREQNAQLRELREEVDKVKEENERIMEENVQLRTAEEQLKSDFAQIQEQHARLAASEEQLKEEQAHARDEISQLRSREQELMDEHSKATEENTRIRGETSRMMDETNRYKDADSRLKAIEQQMTAETESLRAQSAGHLKTISDTEARLDALNRKLRDVIVAFNPTKNGGFDEPKAGSGSGESLTSQLEYMERALATTAEEQKGFLAEAAESSAETAAMASSINEIEASLDEASERVEALARQVQEALRVSNPDLAPPPEGGLDEQLGYLEDAFKTVGTELSRALEATTSASAKKNDIDQVDAVLMGLWDIIQTGYAEIEQQKAVRRQNRALGQGGADDDEELSSSEFDADTNEPYSLQAFSGKVQWLYAQATGLREQKFILQRQIKQQRELNNRSESEKDRDLKAKADELEQTQHLLDEAERATTDAQTQLQQVLADMDTLQKTQAANEAASASSTKSVQDQLQARNARITTLENELREVESRLATAETSIKATQTQLAESNTARVEAEAEVQALQTQLKSTATAVDSASAQASQLQADLQSKDDELDRMNMMVVELKTEVAFAKAELDGAYGSRKQRAAEAAALSNSSQSEELNNTIVRLRAELENALRDLEEITRESIAAERERLEIEGRLDEVLGEKGALEAEVGRLGERLGRVQEELDAERLKVSSPGGGAGGAGAASRVGAGASELSKQFRGVMKEERKKFQEELREEQSRRRKLEDELRSLKRGQANNASSASTARGSALGPR
ncbi:Up-regulated during septation-domain-containing protein [Dichotomopilus funicola]|uniref:Up-regulated during septation-domain-containing protein n=1 Tax=Dichotomopilus funicola TaxID=1934379 RepID=A0AAN6UVM7_9PEZI|nr:Up-regulated during septation-domain-containing protein [Dichotomopilus funicola]